MSVYVQGLGVAENRAWGCSLRVRVLGERKDAGPDSSAVSYGRGRTATGKWAIRTPGPIAEVLVAHAGVRPTLHVQHTVLRGSLACHRGGRDS